MSIYISNNAIQNIPLESEVINEKFYDDKLTSFLNSNGHLRNIVISEAESLSINSKSSKENVGAVLYVRLAIEALDKDFGTEFEISQNYYTNIYNRNLFEENLRDAIMAFQAWKQLPVTGIVDKQTLITIDQQLSYEVYYDHFTKKYLGNNVSKEKISITSNFNHETREFSTNVLINGKNINLKTDELALGNVIFDSNGDPLEENGYAYILPSPNISSKIKESQEFKNINKSSFEIEGRIPVKIKLGELKTPHINQLNIITFSNTIIIDAISELPPIKYEDPYEKPPYLIQHGDTLSQLIENNYYGQPLVFENPYNSAVPIFTSPERQPLPIANRHDDARFQFYINLLYYYNTIKHDDGVVEEWGIKKSTNYKRYEEDHLENENIYNNVYNSSDPQSALPNYHRFLKRMEAHDQDHKINFDNNGNTTSFTIEEGRKLRIPSRQFADSLYYQLNFRQDLFLEPDPDNNDKLRYKPNLLDFITDVTSTLSETIRDSVKKMYEETYQFFEKAYNYAITSLAANWPRGTGGKLGAGLGITWGIPIATDISVQSRIWRKMTPLNEFTIMFRKEGKLGVGADVAAGASLGLYMGKGDKKRGVGLKAGAGASNMYNFSGVSVYEFPIRTEETALLSMIVKVFGGAITQASISILDYFDVINLDPEHYLTKIDIGLEMKTELWAAIEGGYASPNNRFGMPGAENGVRMPQTPNTTTDIQKKKFTKFRRILSNIPHIGVSGTAQFSMGLGFSMAYEYDKKPLVPQLEARVPSKTTFEIGYNIFQDVNFNGLGHWFTRIFAIPATSSLQSIFNFLIQGGGKQLVIVFEGERFVDAQNLNLADININQANFSSVNNNKGGLTLSNNNNYKWNVYVKLGFYTGSPETFCQGGSMSYIKLSLTQIKNLFSSGSLSLDNVLNILYSYEKGYKLGYGFDRRNRKGLNITGKVMQSFGNNPNVTVSHTELSITQNILSRVNTDTWGIQGAAYLFVKVELKMADFILFIKYYLRMVKLRFITHPDNNSEFNDKLKSLNIHRKLVIKAITDKIGENYTEEQLVTELGIEFFNQLFAEGIIPGTNIIGMNGKMKQILDQEVTNSSINTFGSALGHFSNSYKRFAEYYFDKDIPENENIVYGIKQLAEIWKYVPWHNFAALTRLYTALEFELGINLSAEIKAGKLATVRLGFSGELALIMQAEFYDNGIFVSANNPADPYNIAFQNIKNYLAQTANTKINAIKESFTRHQIL